MDKDYFIGTWQHEDDFAKGVFEKEDDAHAFIKEDAKEMESNRYGARIESTQDSESMAEFILKDYETEKEFVLSIWNGDEYDRDDLYICPTDPEKIGEEDELLIVPMSDVLSSEAYQKLQRNVFDKWDRFDMYFNETDLQIDIAEYMRDEQYAAWYKNNEDIAYEEVLAYEKLLELDYPKIESFDNFLNERNDLLKEQTSQLRSMHFWRINHMIAKKEDDVYEVDKSDKAIRYAMDRCDELGVTFKLQNRVLHTAEQRLEFRSIEKEIDAELKENYRLNQVFKESSKNKKKSQVRDNTDRER